MKSTILSTALSLVMSISAFAAPKNGDVKLLNDMTSAFKNIKHVNWIQKASFTQANFVFNNQRASAFYGQNRELIGFSIQVSTTDLPEVVSTAMKDKYSDWSVNDAIMFIDTYGNSNYFIRASNNNQTQVLEISPAGKLSIYARM